MPRTSVASACFAIVSIFLAVPTVAIAQVTDVCGDVSGSWAAGVYRSTCSLRVPEGQILTIAANVILKMDAGQEVIVEGTFQINGSNGNEVYITSLKDDTVGGDTNSDGGATTPAPGDWGGIILDGSGTFDGIGYIGYTTVRYGGGAGGSAQANVFFSESTAGYFNGSISEYSAGDGVRISGCSPSFQLSTMRTSAGQGVEMVDSDSRFHICTFSDNGGHGLHRLSGAGETEVWLQNNIFTDNAGWAALVEGQIEVATPLQYNQGSGNTYNGIALSQTTVTANSGWIGAGASGSDFPLVLLGDLTVADGVSFTLGAYNVFKAAEDVEVVVEGTLQINGSSGSEVYITSLKDDTVGGDTNGDGGVTTPAPGDWGGIFLDGSGTFDGIGYIGYTTVRYGGGAGGSAQANVFFSESTAGYFNGSISEHSAGVGVRISGCSPSFQLSTMRTSAGQGVEMVDSDSRFHICTFFDNGGHGLHRLSGAGETEVWLQNNIFNDNAGWAALLEGQIEVATPLQYNQGGGNTYNGIALSQTTVTATSSWRSVPEFPLVLLGDLTVAEGVLFTVATNNVLKIAEDVEVVVQGTFDADGAGVGSEVFITSLKDDLVGGDTNGDGGATTPAPGDWGGIFLDGSGTFDGIGYIGYTTVRYGGGAGGSAQANVFFSGSTSGWFQFSTSEHSGGDGVRANLAGALSFVSSTLSDNHGYSARIENMAVPVMSAVTGSGNGHTNAIGVSGTVASSQTWTSSGSDLMYVLLGPVLVPTGVTLTLDKGLVVKCTPGSELNVRGTIVANGTRAEVIKITSFADDAVGGDTNEDNDLTSPAPGDWDGIFVDGSNVYDGFGRFDYVWVTYGGNPAGNARANVNFFVAETSRFVYGRSAASAAEGIRIVNSSPVLKRSWFVNNVGYGVNILGVLSQPNLGPNDPLDRADNYFASNDGGGVQIYNDTTNVIDAHYNLWEYASDLEVDAHIWDDDEDPTRGAVLFAGWRPNVIHDDGFNGGDLSGWSRVVPPPAP